MVLLRHPGRRRAVIAVLLVVLAAGWLIGLSRHSPSAGDLILSRGYLVDETRSLSFQDVRKLAFLAFDGTLARGNQHEHLWLSLALPATSGDGKVLIFEPASLRDVVVYQKPPDRPWQASRGGMRMPFETRLLPWLNYSIPVIRVFDKYYLTPGAAKMSGMGLGLYWIRLVSRMMNISIACEMVRDRIIFRLTLPR